MNLDLFQDNKEVNDWRNHWVGMPEYNNVIQEKPVVTATFKFRSVEDFEEFNNLIKKYLYEGEKVFDGMQRKEVKSTWYPLAKKASKFIFENES